MVIAEFQSLWYILKYATFFGKQMFYKKIAISKAPVR